jgi:hypothetical protein
MQKKKKKKSPHTHPMFGNYLILLEKERFKNKTKQLKMEKRNLLNSERERGLGFG